MNTRQRNLQILQMRREGMTSANVARKFNLSTSRIGLIEAEFEAEAELSRRRKGIQEAFRNADDLEKLWPISEMIDAFELSAIFRRRLTAHFEEIGKAEISLREWMDLVTPQKDESGSFWTPLMRIYGIGKIGFHRIKDQLLDTDLGTQANQEWKRRWIRITRTGY